MISIEALTVEFSGNTLFNHITYVVNRKDRIALVGKNGAGKSTMLKIIAGLQAPTSGQVNAAKDITIGYLPQQMILNDERTVMEEAETAFGHITSLQTHIEEMNHQLSVRTDYDSESYHELIDRVADANDQLNLMGSINFSAEIEKTLLGLGFMRNDFNRPTKEFSGGWRMRIELAKLLLQRPDVLLLDEPTNHLDIESIQWLETFIATRANAVILVSHDRAFIDATTTRTIEISMGKIYDYRTYYSHYVVLRAERMEQQQRAFENQQKQIAETEDFIERFRYKATKSIQVQSRIKQLEKIDRIEVDEVDKSRLSLRFPPAPRSGDFPLILENVSKRYGENLIFSGAEFTLKRGDKVAFVGKNGAGKSTLIKCIMQEISYGGKLQIGYNVKIGYFAQNQAQLLNEEKTVFETIDDVAVGDIRSRIRDILGGFMFGGEASDKKVKVLSGGERSRLAMIRLLLEPVNLLILDEPTNHLDMQSKDVLKQAIKDFEGTVIVVSHDRDFLNGLVEKVYEFGNQQIKEHLGGIYDFIKSKNVTTLQELERKDKPVATSTTTNIPPVEKTTENRLSYEERKEQQRLQKKAERSIEQSEKKIEKLEQEIKAIEVILATPEGASDTNLYWKHGEKQQQLDTIVAEWEKQLAELEKIKQ